MQTTHRSSFIRALVDDASTKPFFSSLLALKRQRERAERAVPFVVESQLMSERTERTERTERIERTELIHGQAA